MINRPLLIFLAIIATLTGCVNARFSVPKTVTPSNPVVSSILPGVESATLDASLTLPWSYYAVLNKDIKQIAIPNRTIITAKLVLPPESLVGNTIILSNIVGKLTFSKAIKVKKKNIPVVAISELEIMPGDSSLDIRLDVFQTFIAIILNAGAPHTENEKPLTVQQILPRLNVKNFDVKLRSDHQWSLPGDMPFSLFTDGLNQMSFSSVNWVKNVPLGFNPSLMKGAELLVYWNRYDNTNEGRVGFSGSGNLEVNAKSLRINKPEKILILSDRAALNIPLRVQGETGRPILLLAGGADRKTHPTVTLDQFQLVLGDWYLSLKQFGQNIEHLRVALAGEDNSKSSITTTLHGSLAGDIDFGKGDIAANGIALPVFSDLQLQTNNFTLSVSKGIHLSDVAIIETNGGSAMSAHLKNVNIGPIAISGNVPAVSLVTVSNANVLLMDMQFGGPKGSFHFKSYTGAFLQTTGVLAFSSGGFSFPDSSVAFQDAKIDFADQQSTASISPMALNADLHDILGERRISGEASAVGSARIPVQDKTLIDLKAEIHGFGFDCVKTNLQWHLANGQFELYWRPIIADFESHPTYMSIPADTIQNVQGGLFHDLHNTGGEVAVGSIKVEPFGDGSNPMLNLSGNAKVELPIQYKKLTAEFHIEHKRKIFGWKPPTPTFSFSWQWTGCRLEGGAMANFHNVKMSAKSADTLRDTSIYFKLSPQFSPSVLAGFRPVRSE